jgi:hypothetical protein
MSATLSDTTVTVTAPEPTPAFDVLAALPGATTWAGHGHDADGKDVAYRAGMVPLTLDVVAAYEDAARTGTKRAADAAEPAGKRVARATLTWTGDDGKLRTVYKDKDVDALAPEDVAQAAVGKIKCVQFVRIDENAFCENRDARVFVPEAAFAADKIDTLAKLRTYRRVVSWVGNCKGDAFMREIAIRIGVEKFYDDDKDDTPAEVKAALAKLKPDLKNARVKASEAEPEGMCIHGFTFE